MADEDLADGKQELHDDSGGGILESVGMEIVIAPGSVKTKTLKEVGPRAVSNHKDEATAVSSPSTSKYSTFSALLRAIETQIDNSQTKLPPEMADGLDKMRIELRDDGALWCALVAS